MIPFGKKKRSVLFKDKGISLGTLQNPGRGFYSVYPFDLQKEWDADYLKTTLQPKERLCLVEICLQGYQQADIDQEGLNRLHEILAFFREEDKDVILRFTYDLEGHASEKEPWELQQIETHMNQTMKVVKNYQTTVWLIQGLFVGNWGEMHGSRYITDASLRRLYRTYRRSDGGNIYLAVRTPQQIRCLLEENSDLRREMEMEPDCYKEHLRHLDKIGLFDDGMLASDDDLGTFPYLEEDLDFVSSIVKTPMGGEVVLGEDYEAEMVKERFEKLHLQYLNHQYDTRVFDVWRQHFLGKIDLYQYVEDHMGYRIRLDEIAWNRKECQFEITVTNEGFGGLLETAECRMTVERETTIFDENKEVTGRELTLEQKGTFRVRHASLKSGDTVTWIVPMTEIPKGKYRWTFSLVRMKDGCPIYCSNVKPESIFRVPMEQP